MAQMAISQKARCVIPDHYFGFDRESCVGPARVSATPSSAIAISSGLGLFLAQRITVNVLSLLVQAAARARANRGFQWSGSAGLVLSTRLARRRALAMSPRLAASLMVRPAATAM